MTCIVGVSTYVLGHIAYSMRRKPPKHVHWGISAVFKKNVFAVPSWNIVKGSCSDGVISSLAASSTSPSIKRLGRSHLARLSCTQCSPSIVIEPIISCCGDRSPCYVISNCVDKINEYTANTYRRELRLLHQMCTCELASFYKCPVMSR